MLHFRDTFALTTNNPIVKVDSTKISFFDKDTLAINYKIVASKKENKISFLFDKKPKEKYSFTALPEAFVDIFGVKNDTIKNNLTTKEIEDYGKITLSVENVNNKNVIIDLLSGTNQDEIVERKIVTTSSKIIFDLLRPRKYTIRATIDDNKNNKWDTGSFLKRRLAEKIIYHSEINNYDLRANFFLENINFTIE